MDFPDELNRVKLLLSTHSWFILAYRPITDSHGDPKLEFYWGISAFGEKGSDLSPHCESMALQCYVQSKNGIIEPKASSGTSALGKQCWGLIIATGAIRKINLVIVTMVLAKDRAEVEDCILAIQRIMGATESDVLKYRSNVDSFISFSSDSLALTVPPLDYTGPSNSSVESGTAVKDELSSLAMDQTSRSGIHKESDSSIEQVITKVRCVVRVSEALFGYIFEVAPGAKAFLRGHPLAGITQDEKVLRTYYKPIGDRVLELLVKGHDQAVPVGAPNETDREQKSWFATIITHDLGAPVCAAIVYPLYDRDEAVRTLRLVEMILTIKPLR